MTDTQRGDPDPGTAGSDAHAPGGGAPDIEKLADKVYRLMVAEVRLERARGGGGSSGGLSPRRRD